MQKMILFYITLLLYNLLAVTMYKALGLIGVIALVTLTLALDILLLKLFRRV